MEKNYPQVVLLSPVHLNHDPLMYKNLHALNVPTAPLLLSDMGVLFGLFPKLFSIILLQIFHSITAKIMLLVGRCTFLFPLHFITAYTASLFF